MVITQLIHNDNIDIDLDLDNEQEWVFKKSEDEEASISIKIDESYNSDENHLYLKDTNGDDIEGFTLVCKSEFDVSVTYDCLRDLLESLESAYPKLKDRLFE